MFFKKLINKITGWKSEQLVKPEITLSDIDTSVRLQDDIAFSRGVIDYINEIFGDCPIDLDHLAKVCFEGRLSEAFSWLIALCKKLQTPDGLKYYKSLKPDYEDVGWLIISCGYCQTTGMLKYYKSLKPYAGDVDWLIANCEFCQTEKAAKILGK
jgi:hypothetical protein